MNKKETSLKRRKKYFTVAATNAVQPLLRENLFCFFILISFLFGDDNES